MELNKVSGIIVNRAIEIHKKLGPGLLESAYQECLDYSLRKAGLYVQKQVAQPIIFEEVKLDHGYRIDLLVENKIVVEIKSVEALNQVHTAQILTYLKLSNSPIGLLLNFHVAKMKDGIRRYIL